jgi:hypothetical protein
LQIQNIVISSFGVVVEMQKFARNQSEESPILSFLISDDILQIVFSANPTRPVPII